MKKNTMWIKTPDSIHRNYGIEVWCDNDATLQKFVTLMRTHIYFPKIIHMPVIKKLQSLAAFGPKKITGQDGRKYTIKQIPSEDENI